MRKAVAAAIATIALSMALASSAFAQAAPPCNDMDGDGSPSGLEYAAHHITVLAKAGELGNGGHVPGTHRGFSICL